MASEVRFVSRNKFKIIEAKEILAAKNVKLISINKTIEEIQTEDTKLLVKDKTIKAFKMVRLPLFVEHTGLYIEYLNNFPGGLTQVFWDRLGADKLTDIFKEISNRKVIAKTVIGYIDGKKVYYFDGKIKGEIAGSPHGNRDFQWDCIFIPEGYKETFAELGAEKNRISMRRKALDSLASFLSEGN